MIRKIFYLFLLSSIILSQDLGDIIDEIKEQKPIWTGSFGTVTIDGNTYNQFSLRPEFYLGNWGMGFDFYLYIDNDGNIYDESWNFSDWTSAYQTVIDKLKYIRYGYPGDKFYFKVGALSNIDFGHGILVDGYSNMMRYPEIRKIGLEMDKYFSNGIGLEFALSDFKHSPSLAAARIHYPIASNFGLGLTLVSDVNQNAGLEDSDGDLTPDFIDLFPEIDGWMTDTDGDGLADQNPDEYDIDGDGWDTEGLTESEIDELEDALDTINDLLDLQGEDQLVIDQDGELNPDQVITFDDLEESVTGVAIDFTYHINENFKFYSEFAKLFADNPISTSDSLDWSPGYGMVPFGFKGHYGPFNFKMEYRKNSEHFTYNFWNRSYDINRSMVEGTTVISKSSQLYQYGAMEGLYVNLSGTFLKLLTMGLGYQDLSGETWNPNEQDFVEDGHNRSLLANVSLNTSSIPKIKYLNAFYQRTNVNNPFDIKNPDQNTIFGYDLGINFSESMILVYKARTSYEPDGQGNFRKIYSMFIETEILF